MCGTSHLLYLCPIDTCYSLQAWAKYFANIGKTQAQVFADTANLINVLTYHVASQYAPTSTPGSIPSPVTNLYPLTQAVNAMDRTSSLPQQLCCRREYPKHCHSPVGC